MKPKTLTVDDVNYWAVREATPAIRADIGGPEELAEDIRPCPAVVMPEKSMVSVCWDLNEVELAHLAKGGKLWLTTYGGLPIHSIEVIPKDANPHDPG
jgi:hypothetical protein